MIKKKYFVNTITLIIVGLLISISGSAMFQNSYGKENVLDFNRSNKTDFKIDYTQSRTPIMISKSDQVQTLDILAFDGITPAISSSASTLAAASYSWDQSNVYYYFSLDYGETWDGGMGWQLPDPPELPSIDGCGDGRYIGSFVPSPYMDDGSAMFKTIFDANDWENTFDGMYWNWFDVGDGYVNFIDVEVAGYTSNDPAENTWTYGAHSMIGDDLGNQNMKTPLFSYQCTEDGTAWIYTMGNFTGSESSGIDIDQTTNFCYAAYNYNEYNSVGEDMNLYVFIMDFNTWDEYAGYPIHNDTSQAFINSSGNDNVIDISAANNNIIIVSERDGNIVAYYSYDGLNSVNEVQIDSNGEQPRIVHTGDESAFCSYIKNGVLYTSVTDDGGATWTSPNVNSENGPVYSNDISAFGALYEAEQMIYFAEIEASFPIIEIDSITGGIGVNAIIKNTGTGDATDVSYSISASGGILGLIGIQDSGFISIPAGGETTISLPMIFGIGSITITVTAGVAQLEVEGTQLLIFTNI